MPLYEKNKKRRPDLGANHHKLRNVSMWWNKILARGSIFTNFEDYEEKIHWIGEEPWPLWVSLEALYSEYMREENSLLLSRLSFAYWFRKVSGVAPGEPKIKRVSISPTLRASLSNRWYYIGSLDAHRYRASVALDIIPRP